MPRFKPAVLFSHFFLPCSSIGSVKFFSWMNRQLLLLRTIEITSVCVCIVPAQRKKWIAPFPCIDGRTDGRLAYKFVLFFFFFFLRHNRQIQQTTSLLNTSWVNRRQRLQLSQRYIQATFETRKGTTRCLCPVCPTGQDGGWDSKGPHWCAKLEGKRAPPSYPSYSQKPGEGHTEVQLPLSF